MKAIKLKLAASVLVSLALAGCSDNKQAETPPAAQAPVDSAAQSAAAGMGEIAAFRLCQDTIRSMAKDPLKADIPPVDNYGSKSEPYFAWGASTRMVRMRNGLGIEVAVSASCIVNGEAGKITSLTLDGKQII